MKIVTYNIRFSWSGDGINSFTHRAGFMFEKILNEMPDVIAFQEVIPVMLTYLRRIMPEYTFVGSGRNKDYDGEGLYIAFRTDRYALLGCDIFWLSDTPREAGSRFENQSSCPRIVVEAVLRETETNKKYRIVDVHLDHASDEARCTGMEFLLDFLSKKQADNFSETVILGDFNSTPTDKVIEMCDGDTKLGLRDITKDIPVTFHGFGSEETKIDCIYVTSGIKCNNVRAWDECRNGIYLSDHYPICAEVE